MINRRRILSGMRATSSRLHLGNFEGALRNWVELQNAGNEMFCMVADWHALTTMYDRSEEVATNAVEIAKDYVAAGIDPSRSVIFVQSDVREHAELHLVLSMITPLGWLERVPTYKEKQADLSELGHSDEREPYGLLGYPVLQTADILLYKPYAVPVGRDQAPHLEIGNEIGQRFNRLYGHEVFRRYEYMISEDDTRAKLPGLDMRKMSKSYGNCIYLNDTEDETAQKIAGAFTTPTKLKRTDPGIPEGCAVCQYLRVYSKNWETQWSEDVSGVRGCMQNKRECADAVNEFLRPMRERRREISDDDILTVLHDGALRARAVAAETMDEVREAMRHPLR